jgi:glycerophosphoryl diester phosphodiesterase
VNPAVRQLLLGRGGLDFRAYGPTNPLFIPHRGNSLRVPENTLEGFRSAYDNGVRVVEFDIQLLSDGGLGVMHDTTVDRTTTSTGTVAALDTPGFKALSIDAGDWLGGGWSNGLTPPLMHEVLNEFKGRMLFMPEAKAGSSGPYMVSSLVAAGIPRNQAMVQQVDSTVATGEAVKNGYQAIYVTTSTTGISAAKAAGIQWAGVDETQADSVFQAWLNGGFKVAAWTVNRRYRRDQLLALGCSGMWTDDTFYMSSNTPFATSDNFASQVWQPGMVPNNGSLQSPSAAERGRFSAPNYWGWADSGQAFVLQGWACPIKGNNNADSYSIDLKVTFGGTTSTGWASVFITNSDRQFRDASSPFSADLTGYHLLMRQTGTLQIYKRSDTATTSLVSNAGSAFTLDQEVRFRVTVSPTAITLQRLNADGSVAQTATTNDTSYRGGYFHLGHNNIPIKFREISVS